MRKISTRALALSLSTAMLFSMAACGKDEENPDATPTPDTQGTTGEPGVTNTPDDSNTPDEGEPGTPEPTQGADCGLYLQGLCIPSACLLEPARLSDPR